MKMKSTAWNAPQEQEDYVPDMKLIKLGVAAVILAVMSNALVVYLAFKILNWQELVDATVEWSAALAIAGVYIVARTLDNVFFGRKN